MIISEEYILSTGRTSERKAFVSVGLKLFLLFVYLHVCGCARFFKEVKAVSFQGGVTTVWPKVTASMVEKITFLMLAVLRETQKKHQLFSGLVWVLELWTPAQ